MDVEAILDRFEAPLRRGALSVPPARAFSATNPRCGDVVTMFAVVEHGQVGRVRFQGSGCTISQAAADVAAEMGEGESVAVVLRLHLGDLLLRLGPWPLRTRLDCAALGLHALQRAVAGE